MRCHNTSFQQHALEQARRASDPQPAARAEEASMNVAKRIVAVLALLTLAATSEAAAQDRQAIELRGRVAEVFGAKAIVESGGERLLVEPIAPDKVFPA